MISVSFFKDNITYFGHKISEKGLEKDSEKIKAIVNGKTPENVTEVKALIGMINYYTRFIPDISLKLKPFYDLTENNTKFYWDKKCKESLEILKKELVSENILVHFDQNKPLRLMCDASFYGIAGVLSHIMPDRSEKPICFVSRVLSKSELNYSMIHKEALSITILVGKKIVSVFSRIYI